MMNDKILSNEIMDLKAKKLRPQAPIILIYGPPASGKSTLASEFPDTLFFTTETPFALENEKCGYRKHLNELWDFYDCTHNLIKDFKKEKELGEKEPCWACWVQIHGLVWNRSNEFEGRTNWRF